MAEPLHPSVTEFKELARSHTVVPVWREVLADLETPVSVFLKLVGAGEGFLLESVEHGERWGRFSFIGADPAAEWLPAEIARDTKGFVLTGTDVIASGLWPRSDREPCPLETSVPGVLAAGDIRAGSSNAWALP